MIRSGRMRGCKTQAAVAVGADPALDARQLQGLRENRSGNHIVVHDHDRGAGCPHGRPMSPGGVLEVIAIADVDLRVQVGASERA